MESPRRAPLTPAALTRAVPRRSGMLILCGRRHVDFGQTSSHICRRS